MGFFVYCNFSLLFPKFAMGGLYLGFSFRPWSSVEGYGIGWTFSSSLGY